MPNRKLPPGQQLVARDKWPLVGERQPTKSGRPWTVSVEGLVESPRAWTLEELAAMPRVTKTVDIHCVTRWSRLGVTFSGVPLADLLVYSSIGPQARFVSFVARTDRRHSTSLPLEVALEKETLVVLEADGAPLAVEHGGPVRTVTPGLYFYKSLKWLERIELMAEDRLGYWEAEAGYHNGADPWQEQRYMAATLTKQQAVRVLDERDFAGQDLRGVDAAGRDLSDLDAREAILRDADFRNANLQNAKFDRALLANAHFERADLRRASLRDADLEGANFAGADVRRTNLRGASLFGATFCREVDPLAAAALPDADLATLLDEIAVTDGALIDRTTKFNLKQLDSLTPIQHAYVLRGMRGEG